MFKCKIRNQIASKCETTLNLTGNQAKQINRRSYFLPTKAAEVLQAIRLDHEVVERKVYLATLEIGGHLIKGLCPPATSPLRTLCPKVISKGGDTGSHRTHTLMGS